MKKLMQHKSFIYHGTNLRENMKFINDDISELLSKPVEEIVNDQDVYIYDSKEMKIDRWEEVSNHFLYKPTGPFKVVVFDNADELSKIMQNKLLKPVEDSEINVKIIFNSTKGVIPTIQSRSMMVKVKSTFQNAISSEKELMEHLSATEEDIEKHRTIILKLYDAIVNGKSIIMCTDLIQEKNKALKFMVSRLNEIAQLIILQETTTGKITKKSMIARKFIEAEQHEANLFLMLFELERNGGDYEFI